MNGGQRVHVVAVVGFEDDNLVAFIEQRQARTVKGARGTYRHHDLSFWICRNTVVVLQLFRDRAAQVFEADQAGVRIHAAINRPMGGAPDRRRNFGVADALRQVHAAHFFAFHRHDANLRLHDAAGVLAQRGHWQSILAFVLRFARGRSASR